MSLVNEKILQIVSAFTQVNAQVGADCAVENREDGSALIYGPFPSFLILVEEFGQARAVIHVNADAPNMVYLFQQVNKLLDIIVDGAFAVDSETGSILMGQAAYAKKEENILMFAQDILERRQGTKQEGILVPEKKIIIAG